MAFLFVVSAFACIMADAGAGPHIVHGPYYRFAGSQNLADGVERQHPLVDPVQMDDICLLKFGKRSDVRTGIGDIYGEEIILLETVGFPDDDAFPHEFPYVQPTAL